MVSKTDMARGRVTGGARVGAVVLVVVREVY